MAASGHITAPEDDVNSTALPSFFRSRGRSIAGAPIETTTRRMLSDSLVIILAAVAAILLQHILAGRLIGRGELEWRLWTRPVGGMYVLFFILTYLIASKRRRLYESGHPGIGRSEAYLTAQATFSAGLLLCGALYMTRRSSGSRFFVALFVIVATVLLYIHHRIQRASRNRNYERGIGLRNIIIVGTGHISANLGAQVRKSHQRGYNLCGYVTGPIGGASTAVPSRQILGNLQDLGYLARSEFADELLIAEPCATDVVVHLLEEAENLDINVRAVSGVVPDFQITGATDLLGNCALVSLHKRERFAFPMLLKRLFDIAFSSMSLIMLGPLFAIISLAIFVDSGRPIFYVSERVGKRGRIFPCFKFRTMIQNADSKKGQLAVLNERDGILFKIVNDPRITRIGRILRKYSLDELPQFLNVLRGEMSIVGPRPAIAGEVQQYEPEHLKRLEVAPGLTGLWQVEARRNSSFARYVALDIAYIENWSFWLDLTILIRTIGVVLRGTGA